MLGEFIDDYISSRNPKINIAVLNEIFKLKWEGVVALIQRLTENGLKSTIRTFRRIQVLEILAVFFKNLEDKTSKSLKPVSKQIVEFVNQMATKQSHEISIKEFNTVLDVIFVAHKKFTCLGSIIEKIQEIRKKIKLDSANNYNRTCNLYNVSAIKNSEVPKPAVKILENGATEINSDEEAEKPKENGKEKPGSKRKNNSKQLKKEKKLKKEARLQISSKGFNDDFEFSSNQDSVDVDMSDGSAIEDSEDEE